MPLRPSGRLPSRFNRRFTRAISSLVRKRYRKPSSVKREKFRRSLRRAQAKARHIRTIIFWWSGILLVVALIAAAGFVVFSPLLNLREMTIIRQNPRLDIEKVQSILSPLFGRKLPFVLEREVAALLGSEIDDLRAVQIAKIYPSELRVDIELDPITARLSILEEEEQTATGAVIDYLTDEGVYIQTTATTLEDLPEIDIVDWGVRPVPGNPLISQALLQRLWEIELALKNQFGHEITKRTVYVRAQEIHLQAGGITLWFDTKSSLESHLQRYRIFLQHVERSAVQDYIDLRLSDRVVYR